MPFYVVARAGHQGSGPTTARKGIARKSLIGRQGLRRRHRGGGGEPVVDAAQGQRDLRPDRLRGGRQVQRVRPAPHRRRARRRPEGLLVQSRGRRCSEPGQQLRLDPGAGLHARDEADGGRDPRRRDRERRVRRRRPALPHPLRRHGDGRGAVHRAGGRGGGDRRSPGRRVGGRCRSGCGALRGRRRVGRP